MIKRIQQLPLNRHLLKLVEECAELNSAIVAFFVKETNSQERFDHILEEIVDVEICLDHVKSKLTTVQKKKLTKLKHQKLRKLKKQSKMFKYPKITI